MNHIRRLLVSAAFATTVAATGQVGSPAALADRDSHIPKPRDWLLRGGGQGSMIVLGYCDGVRYPGRKCWHYIRYGVPVIGHPAGLLSPGMQCVVDNGSPTPPPAPPGSCGGAA